ncbi:hypothetical protein ACH40E_40720 [Streptomyces acidicola]|uniref:hypothetical protein n=1 Tax=Streptomyces acidicola TaxID=2596892 RepID=UPI003790D00D
MHRTTTTATLLVTAAVSALSGCVTIKHPAPPEVKPAPTRPSAPPSGGHAEPQVVQAPAQEALERVGPSRTPTPSASAAPKSVSTPAAAPSAKPRRPDPAPPAQPKPRVPDPRTAIPREFAEPPRTGDLCALGRKYGGWPDDSPQAGICQNTYGR